MENTNKINSDIERKIDDEEQTEKNKSDKRKTIVFTVILETVMAILLLFLEPFATHMSEIIIYISNPQNIPVQLFYNSEKKSESIFQIDYVQCNLTSDPVIPGYQVKVYPYIEVLDGEEWEYIPIKGLYTQEQYVADENGLCELQREDIISNVHEEIEKQKDWQSGNEFNIGCMIVVNYIEDNDTEKTVAYELRNGQLPVCGDKKVIGILDAVDDKNHKKIDLFGWPHNKEQIIETIKEF